MHDLHAGLGAKDESGAAQGKRGPADRGALLRGRGRGQRKVAYERQQPTHRGASVCRRQDSRRSPRPLHKGDDPLSGCVWCVSGWAWGGEPSRGAPNISGPACSSMACSAATRSVSVPSWAIWFRLACAGAIWARGRLTDGFSKEAGADSSIRCRPSGYASALASRRFNRINAHLLRGRGAADGRGV